MNSSGKDSIGLSRSSGPRRRRSGLLPAASQTAPRADSISAMSSVSDALSAPRHSGIAEGVARNDDGMRAVAENLMVAAVYLASDIHENEALVFRNAFQMAADLFDKILIPHCLISKHQGPVERDLTEEIPFSAGTCPNKENITLETFDRNSRLEHPIETPQQYALPAVRRSNEGDTTGLIPGSRPRGSLLSFVFLKKVLKIFQRNQCAGGRHSRIVGFNDNRAVTRIHNGDPCRRMTLMNAKGKPPDRRAAIDADSLPPVHVRWELQFRRFPIFGDAVASDEKVQNLKIPVCWN